MATKSSQHGGGADRGNNALAKAGSDKQLSKDRDPSMHRRRGTSNGRFRDFSLQVTRVR